MAKACGVDVQPSAGPAPAGDATKVVNAPPPRRRRHGAKKGRPAQIRKTAADLDGQAPTCARGCNTGLHDMPEATDEEWEHRAQQRMRGVEVGKESQEYQLYCETRKGCGSEGSDELKAPDPHDRTISKRMWNFLLREWRTALAEREHHYLQQGPGGRRPPRSGSR